MLTLSNTRNIPKQHLGAQVQGLRGSEDHRWSWLNAFARRKGRVSIVAFFLFWVRACFACRGGFPCNCRDSRKAHLVAGVIVCTSGKRKGECRSENVFGKILGRYY